MTATISRTSTTVQAYKDMTVTIEPGQPWPGVYRGSKYSLQGDRDSPELAVTHKGLSIPGEPPEGVIEAMQAVGKSDGSGLGSFRVTADKHVLTKVRHDRYPFLEDAQIDTGWVPVYLGILSGDVEIPGFDNDPDYTPMLWPGLCFRHGERWTVTTSGTLEWRHKHEQQFRFPSNDRRSDLVSAYRRVRKNGGRLWINEHGHAWMEAPHQTVRRYEKLFSGIQNCLNEMEEEGRNDLLSLIYRRLERTGGGEPSRGNYPLYVGHISSYDNGSVPVPYLNDPNYYEISAEDPDESE